jgi:hypothetical protein
MQRAQALLEKLRQTPMRRGALAKERVRLKDAISSAIDSQGVHPALAQRIALQLVYKFDDSELGDRTIWSAAGRLLHQEAARLTAHVGLAERQIVEVLPKLSSRQVEDFLEELSATDRTIARTIFNAALEAAEPVSAGRRYLAEYCHVARQVQAIDPSVARTLANATFTAGAPRTKALEFLQRFRDLTTKFEDEVDCARLVSKATFRAPDPLTAAGNFVDDYNAVVAHLESQGIEAYTARTIARLSRIRRDFRKTKAGDTEMDQRPKRRRKGWQRNRGS